jgi:hypothetical protein
MARLHTGSDTLLAEYAPTYVVGSNTLIWTGDGFRRHDGSVATVDMFPAAHLFQGPFARGLMIESLANMLRKGPVHAHVIMRMPDQVGFFIASAPEDWDEGEAHFGEPEALAVEFADRLLVIGVMES